MGARAVVPSVPIATDASAILIHANPHPALVTLRECGHLPMWDDPPLIASTILEGSGI
jgi:pimeloyl-ACP methyl ester carboxylesterase